MNLKDMKLRQELNENILFLEKALNTFKYSLGKCQKIGIKEEYNYEELESFEALTSRFARISDILTQKVFKSLFLILREDVKTFIDRANLAEKLEIINSADELIDIRDIRNEIAHEYSIIDLSDIFKDVLKYGVTLIEMIESTKEYIKILKR